MTHRPSSGNSELPPGAVDEGPPASEPAGFPRVYAVAKWTVILALVALAVLAAAFWTMLLGGFAASGFRAEEPHRAADLAEAITAECAWPYGVTDRNAEAMCRMFRRLTPEQQAQVLGRRK
jgi:hypothetical protein